MDRELKTVLRQLVHGRMIAALGTLHQGAPFVSMVPYAVAKDGCLILHVSGLASHTRDMLDHPDVSLLISEPEAAGKMPQALARVTLQGQAQIISRESEKYNDAREVYLARFPDAAQFLNFRISTFSSSNRFPSVLSPDLAKLSP
jgi:heme iron utilization protein